MWPLLLIEATLLMASLLPPCRCHEHLVMDCGQHINLICGPNGRHAASASLPAACCLHRLRCPIAALLSGVSTLCKLFSSSARLAASFSQVQIHRPEKTATFPIPCARCSGKSSVLTALQFALGARAGRFKSAKEFVQSGADHAVVKVKARGSTEGVL